MLPLPMLTGWERVGGGECPATHADRKEKSTMDLWLALFWTGPIGVGVFLAGLGVLFIGISQLRKK
jgi:hypothetical protein